MTTYFVTVGPNEYKVDISNDQFLVNGQPMDSKLRQLNEQGLYLLQKGNKKLEMLLHAKDKNQVAVSVNKRHVVVQVEKNEALKGRAQNNASEGSLAAPMPGTVIRVVVQEGQTVEKGDVVAILESMKMQMEIKAPFAGKVSKVCVEAGKKIDKGAELVKLVK
jgi:glutaconyl-CoA/methylmalonyl-CoA decarboxylase subunit gamma